MRKGMLAGGLLWIGVVAALGCANQPPERAPVDLSAVRSAVDSLNRGFTAAVAARDTDAIVAYYTPDARFLPANAPRADGHEAIRQSWAMLLGTPGLALELQSKDVMAAEAGDLVVDIGTYRLTWTGPNNQPLQDVGKYVVVMKRVDGAWKLVVDTFNSDLPAVAAEPT